MVWSTDQREVRFGTFRVYCGSIFIREERKAKEVPKYPFSKDRWILERIFYEDSSEILSAINGTYEPIWIFETYDGDALIPTWEALQFLIKTAIEPEFFPSNRREISPDRVIDSEENFNKEVEYMDNYLNNKMPELVVKMRDGEAVAFGGIKRKED